MQPYFLPYLGYFQLLSAVDRFVVYDTIQFTKKGWINRNRILRDGAAVTISLPVRKGSDYLNVVDRLLADDFDPKSLQNQISNAYRKAPYFATIMPLMETILQFRSTNLFDFLLHSLRQCCDHLNIITPLLVSSVVEEGRSHLQGQNRVIDICNRLDGDIYINPPGGRALYTTNDFAAHKLKLQFVQPRLRSYPQIGELFVPSLSILDVMMFNTTDYINNTLLRDFELVD